MEYSTLDNKTHSAVQQ